MPPCPGVPPASLQIPAEGYLTGHPDQVPQFPNGKDGITVLMTFASGLIPAHRQCQVRADNSSPSLDVFVVLFTS